MSNKKYTIRKNFSFALGQNPRDMETPIGNSLTKPNQAQSLKDLVLRYSQGRDVPMHTPIFEEHLGVPNIRNLDKVEHEMFSRNIWDQIDGLEKQLKKEQEEKATSEIQGYKDRIAELEAASAPPQPDPQQTPPLKT